MNEIGTIKIFMPTEDADKVDQLFSRLEEPNFTVIKRIDMPGKVSEVEFVVKSSMSLWFLAKAVQLDQECDERINKIHNDLKDFLKSKK